MPYRRKSIALIGIGKWGKNLARNFNDLGVLHTLCDIDESRLDAFQELYPSMEFTSNHHTIFQNKSITMVAIATPSPTHYHLAKEALTAEKDVYVEKPFCLNIKEAEELIELAKEKKRILMVGHILQFHPCILKLQQMVLQGDLGNLRYLAAHRLNMKSLEPKENVLWDLAPHDISVILSLVSSLPQQVYCRGFFHQADGVAITTLNFTPQLHAHIYNSHNHPFKEHRLVVTGSAATAIFDDTKSWNEKLQVFSQNNQEKIEIEIQENEPLKEECKHFLECCFERKTPKTDGLEALRVLSVIQTAQMSLEETCAVSV